MGAKTFYKCDVCGKLIKGGHQKLFKCKVTVESTIYEYDDGTSYDTDIYYVHIFISGNPFPCGRGGMRH